LIYEVMLFNLLYFKHYIVTVRYTVQVTVQTVTLEKQTSHVINMFSSSYCAMFSLGHQGPRKRNYGPAHCQTVYPSYSPLFCPTRALKLLL
jgi:hypothetical protein